MSRETEKLKANIESQLSRLLAQLKDIEEMKDEMDEDEYFSTKKETIDQLAEFEMSLKKMSTGEISLEDGISNARAIIQAAIGSSSNSPEVSRLFSNNEIRSLRTRLVNLDVDRHSGRLSPSSYTTQACEILCTLEKLGEKLDFRERDILRTGLAESSSTVISESVDSSKLHHLTHIK